MIRWVPNNLTLKLRLAKQKKSLRNTIKKNKALYKETILEKMKLSKKKAKEFWKLLSKLERKRNSQTIIDGISWEKRKSHFKKVLQNANTEDNPLPPNTCEMGPLDFEITKEEIEQEAYILRRGKAPSFDNISNEMISCLLEANPELLIKLFNSILKNPKVINKWNVSMISPIHKKGANSNPDNYSFFALY